MASIRRDLVLDGLILAGAVAGVVGGWEISRPWTLVVLGVALVGLGVAGTLLGRRRSPPYIQDNGGKADGAAR